MGKYGARGVLLVAAVTLAHEMARDIINLPRNAAAGHVLASNFFETGQDPLFSTHGAQGGVRRRDTLTMPHILPMPSRKGAAGRRSARAPGRRR